MDRDWIIVISNSEKSGSKIFRFFGTDTEVKQKLCDLVTEDREDIIDVKNWAYGCETINDVIKVRDGHEYQAYATYANHRIDYTAREFASIKHI